MTDKVFPPRLTRDTEAINPIAMGKTRAKQYSLLKTSPKDCTLGDKVMCVQVHGDASFAGQGVVMECLGLSAYSLKPQNRVNFSRQPPAFHERW